MALKTSKRGTIPPFIVMDVLRAANDRAAKGEDIVHLEVGQPGTSAPARVLDAARRAMTAERLGYTDSLGLAELRHRIAGHYRQTYGVEVAQERIAVTPGSSGAFILAFIAAFDPGDRVALAAPGYPAYRNILAALGVEPVILPVGPETNFQPTPEVVDRAVGSIDGPIDGLIVASPSNPTGTMVPREALKGLISYCADKGIRLISDEIYHGITYGEAAETALAFDQNAIVVNSFSKYFSMTGWRLGWMVVPEHLVRSVECLAQNLFVAPPTISQYAAIAAFDSRQELEANVARYAENRSVLLAELPKAGFDKLASADGAFYIYADVAHMTNDSEEFCRRMLAETGVAAAQGVDFDAERGHHFVRFCFAGGREDIADAARRLIAWRNG